RARDVGAVRDRVRRAPAPGEAGPVRAVRGPSDAEVVRAHEPRGEAVARGRRGRGGGGLNLHSALSFFGAQHFLAAAPQSFVNDWFSNFWVALIVKVVLVMGFVLTAPLAVGYMEHKVLAHMQSRLGPMEAGRFHGWAQLVADGVKFVQKEDVIPRAAD